MHQVRTIFGKARHRQQGQAMVEFALVLPILLTIVLAGLQFGTVYLKWQQLSAGASEGARKAIVSRQASGREDLVRDAVRNAAPNLTPSSSLNVMITGSWDAGDPITVEATFPVQVDILGVHIYDGTISSQRTMRVEQ